ncbi:MAG: hypothetical protein H6728_02425 [Myxococcales bacterium]|nr:hypothetical protein [Myxococcales bacterium]MCB9641910.1 hypothetical protein [Myxococcales bacterium]
MDPVQSYLTHTLTPSKSRRSRRLRWFGSGLILLVLFGWWASRHLEAAKGCPSSLQHPRKQNPLFGLTWRKKRWEGVIQKQLKAGSYTYLQLKGTAQKALWMVVMGKGPTPQTYVKATTYGARTPFFSQRLQRCFPTLYFGRITQSQHVSEKRKP